MAPALSPKRLTTMHCKHTHTHIHTAHTHTHTHTQTHTHNKEEETYSYIHLHVQTVFLSINSPGDKILSQKKDVLCPPETHAPEISSPLSDW